jgi:hypothetical protein
VGGIDADLLAIGGEAGVEVCAPFAGVFGRREEVGDGDAFAGGDFVEVEVLEAVFVGVGVVEDPLVAGQVGAVAVDGHDAFADDFDFVGFVLVEEEAVGGTHGVAGPGEDGLGIAPDEVGGAAVGVEQVEVFAVVAGGEHAGGEAFAFFVAAPAVEEDEALAIGGVEQVVEPVFGVARIGSFVGDGGDLGEAKEEFLLAAFHVDLPEAGVVGGEVLSVGVGDASVAVAGAAIVETAEIGGDAVLAVGAEVVDGGGDGLCFLGLDVVDAADELVADTVVPHEAGGGLGEPLEHGALLPVPGAGAADFLPGVFGLGVDEADADFVFGEWGAAFEADLLAEEEAAGGIKLELVVVAEPVEAWGVGDAADGEFFGGEGACGEEGKPVAAVHHS